LVEIASIGEEAEMPNEPRQLIEKLEADVHLPPGPWERFNGYGVIGLPFKSGHVLAMRRFPVSSVGPGYKSVWHRSPNNKWVLYVNVPPRQACPRYFGAIATETIETDILVDWPAPFRMHVAMPALSFDWEMTARSTWATQLMNAAGKLLPNAAWHNPAVLAAMGVVAGPLLGVGHVQLQGSVPNGQHFTVVPRFIWLVTESRARMGGEDLGPPGSIYPQVHAGDFWIPQRGILAIGQTYFDPFDPERHSSMTSQSPGSDITRKAAGTS
jgi:hypothetical protein